MNTRSTKDLHDEAMTLYEASLLERRAGNEHRMTDLLTQAFQLEAAAADNVIDELALEPTRCILHRSAASLALQLGDFEKAMSYAAEGLRGRVPDEIRAELTVLRDQILTAQALRKTYKRAPAALTQVQKVIRRFTSSVPVNIVGLSRSLGISVRQAALSDNAGEILRDLARGGFSGYSIVVNATDPKVRKRFTVAHELGHFLLHRDRIGNRLVEDRMYRSGLGDTREAEANKLAADLLMPRRLVGDLRRAGISSAAELALRFEVSVDAMRIRLGESRSK